MNTTQTLENFYALTDAEDYFEFFEIDYDKTLVNVKRFHILKEYSKLVKQGFEKYEGQEDALMDFLKFSLLRVYGSFKNGYSPSAADVFDMFSKNGGGCLSCIPQEGNSCGC